MVIIIIIIHRCQNQDGFLRRATSTVGIGIWAAQIPEVIMMLMLAKIILMTICISKLFSWGQQQWCWWWWLWKWPPLEKLILTSIMMMWSSNGNWVQCGLIQCCVLHFVFLIQCRGAGKSGEASWPERHPGQDLVPKQKVSSLHQSIISDWCQYDDELITQLSDF